MVLKQAPRFLQLDSPLGEDVLLLTAVSGQEELSRLFQFQLDMISDNGSITPNQIVGQPVGFSCEKKSGGRRFFHGIVNRFMLGDVDEKGRRNYRAEVVPWLWLLSQTADCRIFQNRTVPEIVEQIFRDLGFADFDISGIKGPHPRWEYCVQYRETDFHFVSRLLEQEGIFYYFRHEQKKHVLVLADDKGAYKECEDSEVDAPVAYLTSQYSDCITSWEHQFAFRPGRWAHTDFNFKTPGTNLMAMERTVVELPGLDKFEVYDYPGEHDDRASGTELVKLRMQEEEASYDIVQGTSLCKSFGPGGKFKIRSHRVNSEEGKSYVITSIAHQMAEPLGYETGHDPGASGYQNRFTCIPASVMFRPARITPKATVKGVQTAIVVGPAGEEIFVDEYGRVKVQFHWDREGKKDDKSSCWIRVAQHLAGQQWGFVFHPRIGQEVLVDFLEGDPDRPIIVGRVYNAAQMPPYNLPGDKTQSGIKTRSSLGGSSDNFNEIRFEDKKGSEQLYIHAEKNQDTVVENDQTLLVGRDRSEQIDRDSFHHILRNKEIQVDGGHTEKIGQSMSIIVGSSLTETVAINYAETVGGAMELTVGGALLITVGAALGEVIGGAKAETIGGSKTENIGTNKTLSVGGSLSETVGKNLDTNVTGNVTVRVGGTRDETIEKQYKLQAKKINLLAVEELAIQVGSATLVMKKNGDIALNGKKINIKGSGDVVIKGSKIAEN